MAQMTEAIARGFFQRLQAKRGEGEALRIEAIRLTKRALADAGTTRVPTDLEALSRYLGVAKIQDVPLAINGRVVRDRGRTLIELNKDLPQFTRRFILAHEIAHIIIGDASEIKYEEREAICDTCAFEMIVPEDLLHQRVANILPTLQSIVDLAEVCQCPVEFAIDSARRAHLLGAVSLLWWKLGDNGAVLFDSLPQYEEEIKCQFEIHMSEKPGLPVLQSGMSVTRVQVTISIGNASGSLDAELLGLSADSFITLMPLDKVHDLLRTRNVEPRPSRQRRR